MTSQTAQTRDSRAACTTDGCSHAYVKRGMCNTCYQRWRAATPLANRQRPTMVERFRVKVDQRGPNDCWPWTGGRSDNGYGAFRIAGKTVGAHRVAYLIEYGVLPETADHDCHNRSDCLGGSTCVHRPCCNPAHLVDRSSGENTLLGKGPSARHARQTHCDSGHEFTTENTYRPPGGNNHRMCRKCIRNRPTQKIRN